MGFLKHMNERMRWFGKTMIPSKYIPLLEEFMAKAGLNKIPYPLVAKVFLGSTALAIVLLSIFIIPRVPSDVIFQVVTIMSSFIVLELMCLCLGFFAFYYFFNMKIFRRTQEIEKVLPDFLDNLKLNMSEGMAFEKAIVQSLEPEFGVLANEIEIMSKKSMTGMPAQEALRNFANKYNSNMLKEAVDVLIIAMDEGSDIVETIDKIVESMRTGRYLVETVRAGVSGFVIFITLISIVIAPVLYGLSLNLLFIFKSFAERLGSATASFFSLQVENLVSEETFVMFSRFSILVVSFFSALIISNLKEGSIKAAVKTIIIYMASSYAVYEISRIVLNFVFGNIIA